MRFSILAAIALLSTSAIALLSASAIAQPYRWVDANGRVQYSDHPPAETTNAKTVKSKISTVTGTPGSSESASGKSAPLTPAEQERAFRKRKVEAQEKAEKLAKDEEAAKDKREACQSAQRSLAGMDATGRVTRTNDAGEREFLNDAEIAVEKERTRKIAASACK
ncbi:MAG: DUF4124 domain-containing protein [Burkholderiales bacterium]